MPKRNVSFYLVKANRISAWLLLVVMLCYIVSGLGLCGRLGVERIVPLQIAQNLHMQPQLVVPMVVLFVLHVGISAYLAFRRWGWIGSRASP